MPELLEDVALPSAVCSAHYFDERDGLVAHAWHQQGVRLLDVTGDEIRQVGYFITPEVLAWAAYFPPTDEEGEIVYPLNAARGNDVLHVEREEEPAAMATVRAPIHPPWVGAGALAPHPVCGYAYALL